MGLSVCLDEELNDTYKLRNSYENKNHFCDEENCRNQWRHFVKCKSLDSVFYLCDYHVKKSQFLNHLFIIEFDAFSLILKIYKDCKKLKNTHLRRVL